MCVLAGREIKKRARDIFANQSWTDGCFQEASYDLRVDTGPYLRIGGKVYDPASPYKESSIEIKPGELALLPTVESFCMPIDLVGDIKIKFSHSRKGLTPLFGPKVDPCFGRGNHDERLYLWVSNLGLRSVVIDRFEPVFTVQFHKLVGASPVPGPKNPIGPIVAKEAREMGTERYLGFTGPIKAEIMGEFGSRLNRLEQGNPTSCHVRCVFGSVGSPSHCARCNLRDGVRFQHAIRNCYTQRAGRITLGVSALWIMRRASIGGSCRALRSHVQTCLSNRQFGSTTGSVALIGSRL